MTCYLYLRYYNIAYYMLSYPITSYHSAGCGGGGASRSSAAGGLILFVVRLYVCLGCCLVFTCSELLC